MRISLPILLCWLLISLPTNASDTDNDGIDDNIDNCTMTANAGQLDSNNDGYGNRCDPDLNNDGIVNTLDIASFKTAFGTAGPDADFSGDGVVNTLDIAMLKTYFGQAPGPSGIIDGAGQPPRIDDCDIFPAEHIWNTRVDELPVHPNSSNYIATIGADNSLHPDFGSGTWPPGSNNPIGIPFATVTADQSKVAVIFTWPDESDPGPYPIPPDAPIEGGADSDGDRHVLILDRDDCVLYELFKAFLQPDGSWEADSGAVFDLDSYDLRPDSWTSADAAGLPILPGLIRYNEVAVGEIRHAVRFTAPQTRASYIWPARHQVSSLTGENYPPMGLRLRLRADYDISGFSPQNQVILRALKTYGMMLADNGSPWSISGAPDERWNNDILGELSNVKGADLEVVDTSALMIDPDSGQAAADKWYHPKVNTRLQIQLQVPAGQSEANTSYDVDAFDFDLFDTPTQQVTAIHNMGKKLICYFSAGSYEEWRNDAEQFNPADLGAPLDGWPGERWLDIRSSKVRQIMLARLNLAKQKDCDGVDPDNVDGYTNNTGFSLTAADQLAFNRFIADEAHKRGMAVGLKNDLEQIPQLVDSFDFAVNEQCHEYDEYDECDRLAPFITANKPVVNIEYERRYVNNVRERQALCEDAASRGFDTLVLPLELDDAFRLSCERP